MERRMRTFIQLALKGKTVVGLPQSLHYNNKDYERTDAEDWMVRVREEVGEELAREKIILTWRQQDSFTNGQKLYPLLDNRSYRRRVNNIYNVCQTRS